jgi:anti-sigma B factor antagonist
MTVDQLLVGDRTAVVCLAGDLDLWSAPQLKRVLHDLLTAGRTRLVLDLGRVGFMDSTALGVLVGVHRRLGADDRMALAAAGPAVLRVLELTGLATELGVFATRDAALESLHDDRSQPRAPSTPPLTADAALMLGIASTAMPFAQSSEEQAERWLRALRNHGESGAILASLGLSEGALEELGAEPENQAATRGDPDAVATVTGQAGRIALERGAPKIATTDVMLAVTRVYGPTFYRALAAHGVDPAELTVRMSGVEAATER